MIFPGKKAVWHRLSFPPPPLGRSPVAPRRAPPVWKRGSGVHGPGRGALWSAGQQCGLLLLEGDQGRGRCP